MRLDIPRTLAAALLLAGAAGLPGGRAETPSVLRVVPGLPANVVRVVENRSVVIETALPFAEVSIAQPSIADVSPLSDRTLYVVGRSRGVTSLTLLDHGGQLIAVVPVQVTPDVAALQSELNALIGQ